MRTQPVQVTKTESATKKLKQKGPSIRVERAPRYPQQKDKATRKTSKKNKTNQAGHRIKTRNRKAGYNVMRAIQALSVVEVRKKKTILRSFAGLLALGRPSAWC